MSYYTTCPKCGASLDPGEKCTCANEKAKESYEASGRYYPVAFQNCRFDSFVCPRRQHFLNAQKRENREHKKGESTCTSQSASRSERLKSGQNMS